MTPSTPVPGQITRRSLLLAGAGVAATAAIPDIAFAARKKLRRSHLDRSTWEPLVGTQVFVRNRGFTPVPLTLVKVGDLGMAKANKREGFRERTFYLVLHGPADAPLAAETHTIKVPGVGKVGVWFSSVRQIDGAWEYIAIFANARTRGRPPKKPRTKGSKEQGRRSGRKRSGANRTEARKTEAPKTPAEKPAAAPEPQAAAPAETAVPAG